MPSPAFPSGRTAIGLCSALALASLTWLLAPAGAQQQGYGQTLGGSQSPQQRDPFQDGPGERDSIIDAANPIDLMNRLRRANALNDATPPGSAIDEALREFEAQMEPVPSGGPPSSGPSRLMRAP